jgi:hypothetical protein
MINNLMATSWKEDEGQLDSEVPLITEPAEIEDFCRRPDLPLSNDESVRVSEAFIALLYISYTQNILARMRTIIFSSSAVLISMMLAVGFYPFAPRPVIASWLMVLLIGLGAVVANVYAGMEKDKVLSLVTNTRAQLGWEFWARFGTFLLPPLLALLTAQFPEASDLVTSFLQPGLGGK